MKLTTVIAAISLSTLAAAAPISAAYRRGLLPSPAEALDILFPNSGIPKLVGKLDKSAGICRC